LAGLFKHRFWQQYGTRMQIKNHVLSTLRPHLCICSVIRKARQLSINFSTSIKIQLVRLFWAILLQILLQNLIPPLGKNSRIHSHIDIELIPKLQVCTIWTISNFQTHTNELKCRWRIYDIIEVIFFDRDSHWQFAGIIRLDQGSLNFLIIIKESIFYSSSKKLNTVQTTFNCSAI